MQLHYGFEELTQIDWGSILPILIPFFLIAFLLIMIALIDLYRHRKTRENVLMWTIVILLFNTIGPILYFAIGRKEVHEHAISNR
ncbi:PLD nuclease N-terminal domain-containing protein [Solibacillus sp. FSL H8-0538]|uniref:PLD nuclease N-terminal domain-containing protein n=1 Tax=Solibacillus sp. FSL H8-0538 TaxID=2921400 RepID=UPI0030F9410E